MNIKKYVNAYRKAGENSEYLKYLKLPIEDKSFLIEAGQGKHFNGNMFALLRCVESREKWSEITSYIAVTEQTKKDIEEKLYGQGFSRFKTVVRGGSEYKRVLATAKYLATDNSFPPFFIKREEQVYLNTWHGTPLKCLGRADIRNAVSIGNVQKNFLNADYLLYPNSYTRDIMMKDYMIDRIYGGKIIMTDYPRNDPLYDKKTRDSIRDKYGLNDKRVIAYMPTWRGVGRSANVEDQIKDAEAIISGIESRLHDDEILYVNFHFLIGNQIDLSGRDKTRMFPAEYETYDFLSACDVLISDYSSVMMDYAGTCRPIIMYMYDYDDYYANKGFYFDIKELPFRQAYTIDELDAELHGNGIDTSYELDDIFISQNGGRSAESVLELLINGSDADCDAYQYEAPDDTTVIYVGDLSDEATRNLADLIIAGLDESDLSKTVIAFENEMNKDSIDYLAGLDDKLDFLRCIPGGSISLSEYAYLNQYRNKGKYEERAKEYFQREYARLFRDVKCAELQFLNSNIYERMGVIACADRTAFHRIPAYFYRRINDAYYKNPDNLENTLANYSRVISYPSDYGIELIGGETLVKGIYAIISDYKQHSDDSLHIHGRIEVCSPIPIDIECDKAYMGSLVFDNLIDCGAKLSLPTEEMRELEDGQKIYRYKSDIDLFADISETIKWYSTNVPVIAARYGDQELRIPVIHDKKILPPVAGIVPLGDSGKVSELKRGVKYFNCVIKDENVTDRRSERAKLVAAFAAHLLTPWHKPILLYEKNSNSYSESASVLYERLIDSGYKNVRFILGDNPYRNNIGERYKNHIVDKYSFAHYYNLFAAKSIIASEGLGHSLETRSTNFLYNTFVLDGNKNYVFLQHGVMYMVSLDAEQRKFFNKGTGKGKQRVVVSSEREKEHFTNNTDYTDDDIYVCGLLKFDTSVMDDDADKIIIMPTWRPWEFVQGSTDIRETGYYKMMLMMVCSVPEELSDRLVVLPHPLITQQFRVSEDDPVMKYCIAETRYDDILRKAKLLITDYSSVSYDAFYRGANVIFYWKDKEECMKEYGANAHLMLTEDLAFGDVCYDADSLAESVSKRYATPQTEHHIANYRQIVTYHDGRNTERFIEMAKRDGLL